MGMFNADLARRVLTYIREHPEQHDQEVYVYPADDVFFNPDGPTPEVLLVAEGVKPANGEYRCMTAACIAGWAVILAGPEAVRETYEDIPSSLREQQPWFEMGKRLLGLSDKDAQTIFLLLDNESALQVLENMVEEAAG